MRIKIKNKNSGFILLFAVTLSSIILSVALGVANVAYKEVSLSSISAKDSNEAFLAADTGAECALFYDRLAAGHFPIEGPASPLTISCAGANIPVSFIGDSETALYSFVIPGLGRASDTCARVKVFKDGSTNPITVEVTSKGYNINDESCNPETSLR